MCLKNRKSAVSCQRLFPAQSWMMIVACWSRVPFILFTIIPRRQLSRCVAASLFYFIPLLQREFPDSRKPDFLIPESLISWLLIVSSLFDSLWHIVLISLVECVPDSIKVFELITLTCCLILTLDMIMMIFIMVWYNRNYRLWI